MWQRFTDRARRVVFFAQETAGRLGAQNVGSEHLLLGLLRESDSMSGRILDRLKISQDNLRTELEQQVKRDGDGRLGHDMQLTPDCQKAIHLAYEEARAFKNDYIGTEHLLLGLIRAEGSLAARALAEFGADLERVRAEVQALQDRPRDTDTPLDQKTTLTWEERINSLFAHNFKLLPAETQAALLGEGLPLDQLRDPSPPLAELIQLMLDLHVQDGVFVLDPNGNARVNITRAEGKAHITIATPVTFVINLLVKD